MQHCALQLGLLPGLNVVGRFVLYLVLLRVWKVCLREACLDCQEFTKTLTGRDLNPCLAEFLECTEHGEKGNTEQSMSFYVGKNLYLKRIFFTERGLRLKSLTQDVLRECLRHVHVQSMPEALVSPTGFNTFSPCFAEDKGPV